MDRGRGEGEGEKVQTCKRRNEDGKGERKLLDSLLLLPITLLCSLSLFSPPPLSLSPKGIEEVMSEEEGDFSKSVLS